MAEDSTRRLLGVFGMAVMDSADALGEIERPIQGCQSRDREAIVAAVRARGVA
jgi:hypothetical protein